MDRNKKNYKTKPTNLEKLKTYLKKIKKTNEINARLRPGSSSK